VPAITQAPNQKSGILAGMANQKLAQRSWVEPPTRVAEAPQVAQFNTQARNKQFQGHRDLSGARGNILASTTVYLGPRPLGSDSSRLIDSDTARGPSKPQKARRGRANPAGGQRPANGPAGGMIIVRPTQPAGKNQKASRGLDTRDVKFPGGRGSVPLNGVVINTGSTAASKSRVKRRTQAANQGPVASNVPARQTAGRKRAGTFKGPGLPKGADAPANSAVIMKGTTGGAIPLHYRVTGSPKMRGIALAAISGVIRAVNNTPPESGARGLRASVYGVASTLSRGGIDYSALVTEGAIVVRLRSKKLGAAATAVFTKLNSSRPVQGNVLQRKVGKSQKMGPRSTGSKCPQRGLPMW
jgi:hypothetical protein